MRSNFGMQLHRDFVVDVVIHVSTVHLRQQALAELGEVGRLSGLRSVVRGQCLHKLVNLFVIDVTGA